MVWLWEMGLHLRLGNGWRGCAFDTQPGHLESLHAWETRLPGAAKKKWNFPWSVLGTCSKKIRLLNKLTELHSAKAIPGGNLKLAQNIFFFGLTRLTK